MALSDFTPDTEEVVIPSRKDGKEISFAVRGLSFNDLSKLIRMHYNDLEGIFDLYESSGGTDLSNIALGKFAMKLINDAPGLVSHVIALGADEEDMLEVVQTLPLTVQVDALTKIGRLTVSDVEDIKKWIQKAAEQAKAIRGEKASTNNGH